MKPLEAAKVLFRNDERTEAKALLQALWDDSARRAEDEFGLFCALVELWAFESPMGAASFIDSVLSGEGDLQPFYERRTLAEQSVLLDWHGQFSYAAGDKAGAFMSFARAASIGRDTALVWYLMGSIHVENHDLELGVRYLRRSLMIHRQPELQLLSGRDFPLGFFSGRNPLNLGSGSGDDFLKILLKVMELARKQNSLKAVRELVVELIHHHPSDERFPKVRMMLEQAIVRGAVPPQNAESGSFLNPARKFPTVTPKAALNGALTKAKGLGSLFRSLG